MSSQTYLKRCFVLEVRAQRRVTDEQIRDSFESPGWSFESIDDDEDITYATRIINFIDSDKRAKPQ